MWNRTIVCLSSLCWFKFRDKFFKNWWIFKIFEHANSASAGIYVGTCYKAPFHMSQVSCMYHKNSRAKPLTTRNVIRACTHYVLHGLGTRLYVTVSEMATMHQCLHVYEGGADCRYQAKSLQRTNLVVTTACRHVRVFRHAPALACHTPQIFSKLNYYVPLTLCNMRTDFWQQGELKWIIELYH